MVNSHRALNRGPDLTPESCGLALWRDFWVVPSPNRIRECGRVSERIPYVPIAAPKGTHAACLDESD